MCLVVLGKGTKSAISLVLFNARMPASLSTESGDGACSSKFGLPLVYDKSYRINFSVVTPDLAYKLRRVQEQREDAGKKGERSSQHMFSLAPDSSLNQQNRNSVFADLEKSWEHTLNTRVCLRCCPSL